MTFTPEQRLERKAESRRRRYRELNPEPARCGATNQQGKPCRVRVTATRLCVYHGTPPAAPPSCRCPVCVRRRRPPEQYDEAPAQVNIHPLTLFAMRKVAREFDSDSVRCPWHKAILLVGQRCPFCDFVREPTTAQDFIDYLDVALRGVA